MIETDSEGIEPPSMVLETTIIPLYEEPKIIINNSWNELYTTFHLRQLYPQPDYLLIIWHTLIAVQNITSLKPWE